MTSLPEFKLGKINKIIVLCASDPKSQQLVKLINKSKHKDLFHIINVNNTQSLKQLRQTQTKFRVTVLPTLVVKFKESDSPLLCSVDLLPQILVGISQTRL